MIIYKAVTKPGKSLKRKNDEGSIVVRRTRRTIPLTKIHPTLQSDRKVDKWWVVQPCCSKDFGID
ncbi:hypothetical protein MRBL20_000430 [Peribacillus frigoritolerans]